MSDEKNKVDTTTEIKNSEMKKAEIKKADANVKTMEDFTSPEILYDELIASVKKYHPSTDISMIEKAYKIAYEAHEGQKRKSGEPYIIHPLCVAIILADLELDKETIVAGLLHDVVEDTVMTTEEITKEFGAEAVSYTHLRQRKNCGSSPGISSFAIRFFQMIRSMQKRN